MAGQAPLAPAALMAQAVQQQELMKLPRWHNNPAKDAYKAEHWWIKFEFAAIQGQWNWEQIQANFFNAMFDRAVAWYQSLDGNYIINDIAALKDRYLSDFAQTANQRAAITDVRISQGADTVINYWSEVHRVMMELELSVTAYAPPANNAAALPTLHALAGAAGAAAVAAADNASLLTDHRLIEQAGYRRLKVPITRAIFIAGLNPQIQDEVVRQNPVTAVEALEFAKKAEKEFLLKNMQKKLVHNINRMEDEIDQTVYERVNAIRGRGGFRGRPGGRGRGSGRPAPDKSTTTCFYCNKKGHWQRECHKRQKENGSMKSKVVRDLTEEGAQEAEAFSYMEDPNMASENW